MPDPAPSALGLDNNLCAFVCRSKRDSEQGLPFRDIIGNPNGREDETRNTTCAHIGSGRGAQRRQWTCACVCGPRVEHSAEENLWRARGEVHGRRRRAGGGAVHDEYGYGGRGFDISTMFGIGASGFGVSTNYG